MTTGAIRILPPQRGRRREVINLNTRDPNFAQRYADGFITAEDIRLMTGQILIDEHKQQVRVGNVATRLIVDNISAEISEETSVRMAGSNVGGIYGIRRKATISYFNNALLAEAFEIAATQYFNFFSKKTWRAWRGVIYFVWSPGAKREFKRVKQASDYIRSLTSSTVTVEIQGPFVEYRRGIIYNRNNGRVYNGWRNVYRQRHGRGAAPGQLGGEYRRELRARHTQKAFQVTIARSINSRFGTGRFGDIKASYLFVPSPKPLPINRWPKAQRGQLDYGNKHIPILRIRRKPKFGR